MSTRKLEKAQLAPDRVDKRNLVVLLLDVSESMGWIPKGGTERPVDELNRALKRFLSDDLPKQPVLSRSGEVAIGSFSSRDVRWLALSEHDAEDSHPFYFVRNLRAQNQLEPEGQTPIGTAILEGLKAIDKRKQQLRESNPPKSHEHRPVLYLVTDGRPEGESTRRLEEAREALQEAEETKKVLFFALGTLGADMETLGTLSVGGADAAYDLRGQSLSQLLSFVSRSSEAAFNADGGAVGPDDSPSPIEDPRDPRLMYKFVRSKYEQEFWDRLDETEFGQ